MRRDIEDTKLTLLVGGHETEIAHQRIGSEQLENRAQAAFRAIGFAFVAVGVCTLLWMLESAGAAAWITAGETERLDGTPAWPLRAMLVTFALFLVSLAAIGGARWWKRRIGA
ncbi:hypothetical protein [Roseiterribacter gracilis]|uniref:Uncharacterized protein n=1 Tax=Roseiterribacter gracilis TaxID=2812848 RepID=A0A8S8X7B1_9PROT|nr:hypothetical protein TMPK1_17050 [Rhodospirillales bacterium TMPK1]